MDVVSNHLLSSLHEGKGKRKERIHFMSLPDRNGGLHQTPVEYKVLVVINSRIYLKCQAICVTDAGGEGILLPLSSIHLHTSYHLWQKSGSQCVRWNHLALCLNKEEKSHLLLWQPRGHSCFINRTLVCLVCLALPELKWTDLFNAALNTENPAEPWSDRRWSWPRLKKTNEIKKCCFLSSSFLFVSLLPFFTFPFISLHLSFLLQSLHLSSSDHLSFPQHCLLMRTI